MNFFKLLGITILFSVRLSNTSPACDIQLTHKTEQQENGTKITVTASGGAIPYKYIFYKKSGELLSENFNSNSVTGLPKGTYSCTVVDKKDCRKAIEIEIQ